MSLKYPGEWKFAEAPEVPALPASVVSYFHDILRKIAGSSQDEKFHIEAYKVKFGALSRSTSLDWAVEDLRNAMEAMSKNSAAFLDALWMSLQDARNSGLPVPSQDQVNTVLRRNGVGFQIHEPDLLRVSSDATISERAGTDGDGLAIAYKLGRVLGRGGFGEVYLATRDTSIAEFEYALKLLHPSPFTDRQKAILRFQREIKVLQVLQHRGIIPHVDAGIDNESRPYLVMPYVVGCNIRDAAEGQAAEFSIAMMSEVLLALEYAHANKVLHRDLKPSNIIVRKSDSQPIVLDFGTAYFEGQDGLSLTTNAVGSAGYIPSEVLANPSHRSPQHDVFSCAVILYEMILRRRPDPQNYTPLISQYPALGGLDDVLRQALGPVGTRHGTAALLRADILRSSNG